MKFARVISRLYCEEWLVGRELHVQISDIVVRHFRGEKMSADAAALFGFGDDEKAEPVGRLLGDGVAVVTMDGMVSRKLSNMDKVCGLVDVDEVAEAVGKFAADKAVTSIVLKVDSPGGTVGGVPELATAIRNARAVKPVVCFVDGLAASAAYWVASQSDEIVMSESASAGSVGVYMALLDESRALEINGYHVDVIKSGRYKGAGIRGTALTDDQRANMQAGVTQLHEQFKAAVRAGRGVSIRDEDMEGQLFSASDSVSNKMADMVGAFADAVKESKILAGVKR